MSDSDRLLKALGALAREQELEDPPRDLLQPPAARLEQIVDQIVPVAGRRSPPQAIRRPTRKAFLALFAVPVAAAAAWLMWMGGARSPLPEYVATASGGLLVDPVTGAPVRGLPGRELTDEAGPVLLEPGLVVEIVLRPASAVGDPLEVQAFWRRSGEVRRWTASSIEMSRTGSARLSGTVDRPFGPGEGELILVVARAGQLPSAIGEAQLVRPPADWRIVRQPVKWR